MSEAPRITDLKLQRVALEARIKEAAERPAADVTVPAMERALQALDDLIAREEAGLG